MPEWAIGATWALARVPPDLDILDVGTAYAAEAYAAAVQRLAARRLVLVDAATTGLPVVEGDVRALPFAPASFDVILCLNTLHHVGADNRAFDLPAEHKPASQVTALASLRQTVRPDGRVFIAVPCGAPADLGMMTIRSAEEWLALFEQAGFFVFEQEVYELTAEGWLSHDAPYPSPEYGQRGPGASALLQAELRPGRLRQTARRALGRAARSLGY
jgi:SAM-dependent methyltransferase